MTNEELVCLLKDCKIFLNNSRINPGYRKILKTAPHLQELITDHTRFIFNKDIKSFHERLFCIKNGITRQVVCFTCSRPVKFRTNGIYRNTYPIFCSSKCFSPDIHQKRKITNLQRYNVENPIKNQQVRLKQQQTNLLRYGSISPFGNQLIQTKIKQTNHRKYGVDNAFQNEQVKAKQRATNYRKYSVDNAFQNEQVKAKQRATMLQRYGVKYPQQIKEARLKAEQTCIKKYNAKTFSASHIPVDIRGNLDNKQLLEHLHHKDKYSLTQIALMWGISTYAIHYRFKCFGIKIKRYGTSKNQQELQNFIQQQNIDIKINVRICTKCEVDILIPSHNIAIEYNGIHWHGELQGRGRDYHLRKQTLCEQQGIQLIQIWENEWVSKQNIIKSRLLHLLGKSTKIYARRCSIREINSQQETRFFNDNHIQGYIPSKVCYGLFLNNELVAASSFSYAHYSQSNQYELLRFANKLDTIVVGGMSKLYELFIQIYQPKSVVSYCDVRWNTGKSYCRLGFIKQHRSTPNYFYFKVGYDGNLYSRIQFQKHKLATRLKKFNSDLTEWENMVNNGYDRIWDCGNDVWVWSRDDINKEKCVGAK